jgi:hypothetical protein
MGSTRSTHCPKHTRRSSTLGLHADSRKPQTSNLKSRTSNLCHFPTLRVLVSSRPTRPTLVVFHTCHRPSGFEVIRSLVPVCLGKNSRSSTTLQGFWTEFFPKIWFLIGKRSPYTTPRAPTHRGHNRSWLRVSAACAHPTCARTYQTGPGFRTLPSICETVRRSTRPSASRPFVGGFVRVNALFPSRVEGCSRCTVADANGCAGWRAEGSRGTARAGD